MTEKQSLTLRTETLACCPICGGGNFRHLLVAPDYESHSGEYGIDECAECSVAFTNPRPLDTELPKLYAQRTSADFAKMGGFAQRLRSAVIDRYLARQLDGLPIDCNVPFRVLDYGCGDGALVNGLLRLGQRSGRLLQVTAVDFHEVAPPSLVGAEPSVTYQVNAAWTDNPGCYDVIFLRHVLEHHSQPLYLLATLAATLRPSGRLFIEVPNRRSVWAGLFGCHYFGYYLPRHLFHFDRASLAGVLHRAGFRDVTVQRAHHPMIGGSLRYATGLGTGNTSLVGLASYPLQIGLDVLCGRSTTLLATATHD